MVKYAGNWNSILLEISVLLPRQTAISNLFTPKLPLRSLFKCFVDSKSQLIPGYMQELETRIFGHTHISQM